MELWEWLIRAPASEGLPELCWILSPRLPRVCSPSSRGCRRLGQLVGDHHQLGSPAAWQVWYSCFLFKLTWLGRLRFPPTPPEWGKVDVLGLEGRKCVTLKESCNWKEVRGRGPRFADLGEGKFMCRGQEGARDLVFYFYFLTKKQLLLWHRE